MVGAAARHFQHGADDRDGVAGGLANGVHHFPELEGNLVPEMSAAFIKNVILHPEAGIFVAQLPQAVRWGPAALGCLPANCRAHGC